MVNFIFDCDYTTYSNSLPFVHNRFQHIWKSQHVTTNLVWRLACYLHKRDSEFVEESYLMAVDEVDDLGIIKLLLSARLCQSCMINKAGVSIVSFEEVTSLVLVCNIRSSIHGLVRVLMQCNNLDECPNLHRLRRRELQLSKSNSVTDRTPLGIDPKFVDLLKSLSSKESHINELKFVKLLQDYNFYVIAVPARKMEQVPQGFGHDTLFQSNDIVLCISRKAELVTAGCRICMRQASSLGAIAEIPVMKHGIDYIMNVLSIKVGYGNVELNWDVSFKTKVIDNHLCNKKDHEKSKRPMSEEISPKPDVFSMATFVRVEFEPSLGVANTYVMDCMRCLAFNAGETAYWMNIGVMPSQHAYILVSYKVQPQEVGVEQRLIKCLTMEKCRNNEVSATDISTISLSRHQQLKLKSLLTVLI